ncbi:VOC family protein [Saccharopolyspora cebuensis]|uniref:VOC family protein n=1 Tax=Saccharopolyspora cebuensis TaxID=418759 RepID=A0ABV4CMV9_9PSEU
MSALNVIAFALDCPDPHRLAGFYGRLLGWEIDEAESAADWVELAHPEGGVRLAFQRDPHYRPTTWPSPEVPQKAHVDVRVDDLDTGHERALAAGATQLPQPPDQADASFRVYADPDGHPFCLCA